MPETYSVLLQKDTLIFSAAHFITFAGDICERLHGHNYQVTAEVYGPLDQNAYVVDFILLRDTLGGIVRSLDHYMLLPTQHPAIQVRADDQSVEVRFAERRWVFPRGDCVLLPVPNTTAEMLARHLGGRLREELARVAQFVPQRLRISVDECHGQCGVYDWQP